MYLPDDKGEYMSKVGMQNISIQGLSNALMTLESEVTVVQPPAEEYALLLEVTMAVQPRYLYPPTFSWDASMVLHPEVRSHASGSGACAGGWPGHHLSFLL